MDADGSAEILGRKKLREQQGPCGDSDSSLFWVYVPTYVYRLKNGPAPSFILDEKLSEQVNKKERYPWASLKELEKEKAQIMENRKTGELSLMRKTEAGPEAAKCFK